MKCPIIKNKCGVLRLPNRRVDRPCPASFYSEEHLVRKARRPFARFAYRHRLHAGFIRTRRIEKTRGVAGDFDAGYADSTFDIDNSVFRHIVRKNAAGRMHDELSARNAAAVRKRKRIRRDCRKDGEHSDIDQFDFSKKI